MTMQLPDNLLYRGKEYRMRGYPLNDYFAQSGIANPFGDESRGRTSLCWNGYVAAWSVEDGRLYLKEIRDIHGKGEDVLNLETVFPGHPDGVFAYWYSGTITPSPNIHGWDFNLVFRDGILISEK